MKLPAFVGRYIVKHLIGRGAFASVVLAWDEELKSFVAIKILDIPDGQNSKDFLDRFVDEARLLRRIRSHNVIGVHDVGRLPDGSPYIVMDYADMGTLSDLLEQDAQCNAGLPLDKIAQLAEALSDGLSAIHKAGVVHRDLKPENILLQSSRTVSNTDVVAAGETATQDAATQVTHVDPLHGHETRHARTIERIMISDLGIAKDLDQRGHSVTILGGTPLYRAPEQIDPDGVISPATDVFAATAVLWFALTGKPPPAPHKIEQHLIALPEPWWPIMRQGLAIQPKDRFENADSWFASVLDALTTLASASPDGAPSSEAIVAAQNSTCPYLGLHSFQLEDSNRFFGREVLVEELLRRLRSSPFLVVGGPSGSGKSSLVRSGLSAALINGEIAGSEHWKIDTLTPGRDALVELYFVLTGSHPHPAISLESFLDRPSLARQLSRSVENTSGRVLIIDQFEELFTLNAPDHRKKFIDSLASIADQADSFCRIVLVVRADFYAACAEHSWLADRITHNQVLVGPMTNRELRRAITEPARVSGYYLERDLVDTIIDDAGDHVGSLPLISHALAETWKRRKGATLTQEGYQAAGGVAGAIRQTADEIFDTKFAPEEHDLARRLFLALVTPGEGTSDSRRIIDRQEIEQSADSQKLLRMVDLLTEARLLTVDDKTIQITHEALLRSWPRLTDWIEESRSDLRTRQRVSQLANDWATSNKDDELLLRGTLLLVAQEWLEKDHDTAGKIETDFLVASQEAKERHEKQRQERDLRARKRRMFAIAALSVLAVGTTFASVLAIRQTDKARENELAAEAATHQATERFASALGAVAQGYTNEDPLLALHLAVESITKSMSPAATYDARFALIRARDALQDGGPVLLGSPLHVGDALSLAIAVDGSLVAVGRRDGTVLLIDGTTRRPLGDPIHAEVGGIEDLVFDKSGKFLVAAGNSGKLVGWSIKDQSLGPVRNIGEISDIIWRVAFRHDGKVVASAGEDGAIRIWDLEAVKDSGWALAVRQGDFTSTVFSHDGNAVLAGNGSGEIFAWRYPGGDPVFETVTEAHSSDIWQLAFSPKGDRFATVSSDGKSSILDFPSGQVLGSAFSGNERIKSVAFSNDGRTLFGSTDDGRILTWDLETSEIINHSGSGHLGQVVEMAASGSSVVAVTLGDDQLLRFWRIEPPLPMQNSFPVEGQKVKSVAINSEFAVAAGDSGDVVLWNLEDNRALTVAAGAHNDEVWAVAMSPDGSIVASGDRSGIVSVVQTATGKLLFRLEADTSPIWTIAFLPNGRFLTASAEAIKIWDVQSGKLISTVSNFEGKLTRAAVSEAGDYIAYSTESGQVVFWPTDKEAQRTVLDVSDDVVWAVNFSPDGKKIMTGTSDEVLSVWDLATGLKEADFTGHSGGVTGVAVLGDNATLIATDRRGGVHFWDLHTKQRLAAIPEAHKATIWRIAVHPDGVRFATAGDDGFVRFWDTMSISSACRISGATFDPERRERFLGSNTLQSHCDKVDDFLNGRMTVK